MNTKYISLLTIMGLYSSVVLAQIWPIWQIDDPTGYYIISCTVGEIHETGQDHFHQGIDIDCNNDGRNIRAIDDGIVQSAYGSFITIDHSFVGGVPQRRSSYLHLEEGSFLVSFGETVQGGEIIATVTNHLHLNMYIRDGNDWLGINPLKNDHGWELDLPNGHPDNYPPQINDILIEGLNTENNNVPSGFRAFENVHGAIPFHDNFLKVHFNNTEYSTLSEGQIYNYPNEKVVVWGNIGFIVNVRDVGCNTIPINFTGQGLTVSDLSYSWISSDNIEHQKYIIDFSEINYEERNQINELFRVPYFPEQMPDFYLYGNHDFIELRSTNDVYLSVHQQINGIQSNGIWFTKADTGTPHVFNQTPTQAQVAQANEFTLYADGEHTLRFHVEDASNQEQEEDLHLVVDNFLPFVKRLQIYKNGNSEPEYSRSWAWNGNGYTLEQEPACYFLTSDELDIYAFASEQMSEFRISVNGSPEIEMQAINSESTEWHASISPGHIVEGQNQITINGEDLAENNLSQNPAVIPVHQQNGLWNPNVSTGQDTYHTFTAEEDMVPSQIDFSATNTLPDLNEWITLNSIPELEDYQYNWVITFDNGNVAFENGTSQTSINPVLSFSVGVGKVDIELTVTNDEHTLTKYKEDYIQVINLSQNPAIPDFSTLTGITNIPAGSYVDFIDLSENEPNTWYWTFEGGEPDHVGNFIQNPEEIYYSTPGFYDVSLQVHNGNGSVNTLTKENYIAVYDVLPILEMNCWANKSIVYLNENVTIHAEIYGGSPPYVYTFNFNNEHVKEVTSSMPNEQASFAFNTPGNKTITVGITDNSNPARVASCDDYLTVEHNGPLHTVDFTWEPQNPLLGEEISFTNLTTAPPGVVLNYSHWLWEADLVEGFTPAVPSGDPQPIPYSEMYSYPYALDIPCNATFNEVGSYPVTLTVSDMNGWMVSKTKYINFNEGDAGCIYFDGKGDANSSNGMQIFPSGPIAPDDETISFLGYATIYQVGCLPPQDHYEYITDVRWKLFQAENDEYVSGSLMKNECGYTCTEMASGNECINWFSYQYGNYATFDNIEMGEYYVQCEIWNRCSDDDVYNDNYLQPSYAYTLPYYDVVRKYFKVVDCDEEISFSLNVSGNHPEIWAGTINLDGQVQSEGKLHCVGHEEVNMLPGFTAHQGCDFNAEIIPCPDCSDSIRKRPDIFSEVKGGDIDLVNVESIKFQNPFEIYPNPTSGMVNIAFHEKQKNLKISIKQMNGGNIIAQKYDYSDNIILDLSPYPKGIYLLTITTEDRMFTEKVILQ